MQLPSVRHEARLECPNLQELGLETQIRFAAQADAVSKEDRPPALAAVSVAPAGRLLRLPGLGQTFRDRLKEAEHGVRLADEERAPKRVGSEHTMPVKQTGCRIFPVPS